MIKVWVLYVLIIGADGSATYSPLWTTRDRVKCIEAAQEIVRIALRNPTSSILGATCSESKA